MGCAQRDPIIQIEYVRQPIDESLLHCKSAPRVPTRIADKVVARFIIEIDSAGDDCRGKLNRVRKLLNEFTTQNER